MPRALRLLGKTARWLLFAVAAALLVVVVVLVGVQTGWAKNLLRELIVRQANQYLTATLTIGKLGGSLFRGIELGQITLSRDGRTLISIDDLSVSYSIRELFDQGTLIREVRIARPHVVAQKQADGRWDLGALVRRDARVAQRTGPGRPIHIRSIVVSDGSVSLLTPVTLGAAHVPAEFHDLDATFAFDYVPVAWRLAFANASFTGAAPDLRMARLSGEIRNSSDGWAFDNLLVQTARSQFTLDGQVDRRTPPTRLDLKVAADHFAFQEWSGVLTGLKDLAIEGPFETALQGPLAALSTTLDLRSAGGNVKGMFVLDTTAPGWRATGTIDVARLNLARWLNRPDRPSDITGRVTFGLTDIGLRPGGHFPIGTYAFSGSHAAYLDYEADDMTARGDITATDARIAEATFTAYGANVRLRSGSIGVYGPNRFAFVGLANGVDLRQVPKQVPVPHVESTLTLDFDVTGQFTSAFLIGQARFGNSSFLGARVGDGTVGSIDTSVEPFHYSGEGDLTGINLHRFGADLDVDWLQDPRYAGTVDGHFHVDGSGSDAATMTLNGGGRLERADLFRGALTNADVTIDIRGGSLTGSYDGQLTTIDPSIALNDERYGASLTGTGRGRIAVRDLLVRTPELHDYSIDAQLSLGTSRVRTIALESADLAATLEDGSLTIARFHGIGPAIDLAATGRLEFDPQQSSLLDYTVARGDLAMLKDLIGRDVAGSIVTKGQLTGPADRLHLVGTGTLSRVEASGMKALAGDLSYDATIPPGRPAEATGTVTGRLSFVEALGQELQETSGSVAYDNGQITTDLQIQRKDLRGSIAGTFVLHPESQVVDLHTLTLTVQQSGWRLVPNEQSHISWTDRGITVKALTFVDATSGSQRLTADGTWYSDGGGALRVTGTHVSLDALTGTGDGPTRYGGTADLDLTLGGTRMQPTVAGTLTIVDGRIWRVAYETLKGRVDYAGGIFQIDLRLDQRPGVWLTANGSVPTGAIYGEQPEQPIDVALKSSSIDLGLIEGVTNVVRDVSGEMTLDVRVVGTSKDPHFDGRVDLVNAAFLATASGARYKNGRVAVRLATDRVTVETLHLEDVDGDPLNVSGSLGTHELRVGDLEIDVSARSFEVLRNEFGRMDIDATIELRGQFESPRLEGAITVSSGQLNVDAIFDRTMLQPYAVQAAPLPEADAIVALNPWERLGLGLELHVPGTLRMVGDNIQLTPGTPLGLGNVNVRAIGDLYLYKDPGQPLYITGSLDSLTGTYAFQGKRFDLDPISSINFQGDLNPELYVTVTRDITGVQTRVTIAGPLREPELRLASTPALEASDILSLIVFNTSTNQLSSLQQQQLAIRAGTLAAGFLAAPMMSALERSLGLDTLEIEPGADIRAGARVTIGNEIAPGLVARFSRQFGTDEYDEATIEYYLSRILRIRATFSDAGVTRSPFRRVERAGVDLLLFFSF